MSSRLAGQEARRGHLSSSIANGTDPLTLREIDALAAPPQQGTHRTVDVNVSSHRS
jgi:hypothetical protein